MARRGVLGPDDPVEWSVQDGGLLVAVRADDLVLAVAMGDRPVQLPAGVPALTSGPLTGDGLLPPDTAAWLRRG